MPQTPERAEYLRQYRLRKKAEYAAKKAERVRRETEESTMRERVAENAAANPAPEKENTSGTVENKTDLLNEFLGAVGPKINPRPIAPDEKDSEGTGTKPPIEKGAVFIRGSLFRLIGIRLNKMFDTKEFELSQEESDCLADALQGGLEYSHVSMNPWAAFAIMLLMWLLPLVWIVPQKMGWGKEKKKQKGIGENDGPKWGLRPNRFFGDKIPTMDDINRLTVGPESPATTPDGVGAESVPVPGPTTQNDIATRDAKLARAYDNSGVAANG